jgi:hypothetical protein
MLLLFFFYLKDLSFMIAASLKCVVLTAASLKCVAEAIYWRARRHITCVGHCTCRFVAGSRYTSGKGASVLVHVFCVSVLERVTWDFTTNNLKERTSQQLTSKMETITESWNGQYCKAINAEKKKKVCIKYSQNAL